MDLEPEGGASWESFARITRARVLERLVDERVVAEGEVDISIVRGLPEAWEYSVREGRSQPYGAVPAGRVLIGPEANPLGGLVWARERSTKYIHQVWVDDDARGRGVGRMLVDIYREYVSPKVVISGPFSPGGLALARAVGAKVVNLDEDLR